MISSTNAEYARERIDLGGTWQLALDPDNRGLSLGWASRNWPEEDAQEIPVPSTWNRFVPDAEGVGFYKTHFSVPPSWPGRSIKLCFGGASYAVQVWLNGQYVGRHEGAYTPFIFDITDKVKATLECELVVRVSSLSGSTSVDGMVLTQTPAAKQSWHYANGGLWGDVTLEARPLLSVDVVAVNPDIIGECAEVEVALVNRATGVSQSELRIEVESPGGAIVQSESFHISVPPGESRYNRAVRVSPARLWTCEDPHLYTLRTAILNAGEQVDVHETTFGMRSFQIRNGEFLLNNVPIFIKGILLQPNYPITDFVPPDPGMMTREIELMKAAGFNLIRAHLRPAPPGYLDITDRLGMLVYAESSMGWIEDSPRLLDHCKREMRSLVERDRNHPSVVIWGVHNENRAASAITRDALIRDIRAVDPTRVIIDNSGGSMAIDQDYGWVDRTTAVDDRETLPQEYQDVHLYLGSPIDTGIYRWLRTLGTSEPEVDLAEYSFGSQTVLTEWTRDLQAYRGKVFVSEMGCGGMANLDDVVAGFGEEVTLRDAVDMATFRDSLKEGFRERRLEVIFGTVRNLIDASQQLQVNGNVRQIEALMCNPRVSGYGLTALNDVGFEFHAGILDHWRNPKPAYAAVARLNRPQCLILRSAARVLVHGEVAKVAVTLVQRGKWRDGAHVVVSIYRNGDEWERSQQTVSSKAEIAELDSVSFATKTTDAGFTEWEVVAQLVDLHDGVVAETRENILSMPLPDGSAAETSAVNWIGPRSTSNRVAEVVKDERVEATAAGQIVIASEPGLLTTRQWDDLLDAARGGAQVIIGPIEATDGLVLQKLSNAGLEVTLNLGIGNWMGCYHWVPDSDLFRGLPAGGLAGEPYAGVLPRYVMNELGGTVLAGSFRNTREQESPLTMLWYSDIEQLPFGQGSLTFCQYRIFDRSNPNPITAQLLINLLDLTASAQKATIMGESF